LISGCTTTLKNQGDIGFRASTEWAFFHRAAKTSDEPATSNLDVPSIEELILKSENNKNSN